MQDKKLEDYFKFEEADLQANREGHFSTKQMDMLAAMDSSDNIRRKISGVGSLIVALAWLGLIMRVHYEVAGGRNQARGRYA